MRLGIEMPDKTRFDIFVRHMDDTHVAKTAIRNAKGISSKDVRLFFKGERLE